MLDSLGSTLTQETLEGYYTENNVDPHEGELTVEEVIRCLEHEIAKSWEEKKRVEPEDVSYPPVAAGGEGASTPSLSSLDVVDGRQWPNEVAGLDVTGPSAPGPQDEDPTRAALLGNGEVMNQANVMVDEAGVPFDVEDDEDDEDNTEEEEEESVERVINIRSCPLCHRGSLRKKGEMDIVSSKHRLPRLFCLPFADSICRSRISRSAPVRTGAGRTVSSSATLCAFPSLLRRDLRQGLTLTGEPKHELAGSTE